MPLAPQQIRKLKARLKPQHIRTRETEGRTIAYLEGWHVIAEANRIFGFDGWDRELIDSACVYTRQQGERFNAAYTARIRIKVRAGEHMVTREGSGAGEASASSPGQAHELAMKAAETDATKRALMTFGNPFGLSLYGPAKDGQAAGAKAERRLQWLWLSGAAFSTSPTAQTGARQRHGYDRTLDAATSDEGTRPAAADGANARRDRIENGAVAGSEHSKQRRQPRGPARGEVICCRLHSNPALQVRWLAREHTCCGTGRTSGSQPSVNRETDQQPDALEPSQTVPSPFAPSQRLKIDKSVLALAEPTRIRDHAHLKFVASQPCLICGRNKAQAHHLRFAQPKAMGRKVSDEYTVPLCSMHHRLLHETGNEIAWWEYQQIDPLKRAAELWRQSRLGNGSKAKSATGDATLPK